jgi:hypothetical protein
MSSTPTLTWAAHWHSPPCVCSAARCSQPQQAGRRTALGTSIAGACQPAGADLSQNAVVMPQVHCLLDQRLLFSAHPAHASTPAASSCGPATCEDRQLPHCTTPAASCHPTAPPPLWAHQHHPHWRCIPDMLASQCASHGGLGARLEMCPSFRAAASTASLSTPPHSSTSLPFCRSVQLLRSCQHCWPEVHPIST